MAVNFPDWEPASGLGVVGRVCVDKHGLVDGVTDEGDLKCWGNLPNVGVPSNIFFKKRQILFFPPAKKKTGTIIVIKTRNRFRRNKTLLE